MATFADLPQAQEPLATLVLDAKDTYVTVVTAESLLRRKDSAGMRLIAEALGRADLRRREWISNAVQEVYMVYAADRDDAVRLCEALGSDETISRGASELIEMLIRITPLLEPA
jgi:hypothetical protein